MGKGGDLSREAIIANLYTKGGDYTRLGEGLIKGWI